MIPTPAPPATNSPGRLGRLFASFTANILKLNTILLLPWIVVSLTLFAGALRNQNVDFRNLYTAGYMVRTGHGHDIYDYSAQKIFQNQLVRPEPLPLPFIRPAYQALFFAPFSLLPFLPAYLAFFAFNLAVLALCLRLLRTFLVNLSADWLHLRILFFFFPPIAVALIQGQDSILLLALLAGALVCLHSGRESLAGALTALGLFKFQLVLPIFVLFLLWKRWRFSAAFLGVSAVLAGVSLWIVGLARALSYSRLLFGLGSSLGFGSGPALEMQLMANLHGAVFALFGKSPFTLPLTIAASAVTILLLALRRPRGSNALLVAIPASALVSYYMYVHDMSILILPLLLALNHLRGTTAGKLRYQRTQTIAAFLLLSSLPCLMFVIHYFWLAVLPLLAFTISTAICPSTTAPCPGQPIPQT